VLVLEAHRDHLKRNHERGSRELALTRSFASQGVVSNVELLQLEQRTNDLLPELHKAELNLPRLRSTWKEQINLERELLLNFSQDAQAELLHQEIRLARLRESRKSLEDQVYRRLLTSSPP